MLKFLKDFFFFLWDSRVYLAGLSKALCAICVAFIGGFILLSGIYGIHQWYRIIFVISGVLISYPCYLYVFHWIFNGSEKKR